MIFLVNLGERKFLWNVKKVGTANVKKQIWKIQKKNYQLSGKAELALVIVCICTFL